MGAQQVYLITSSKELFDKYAKATTRFEEIMYVDDSGNVTYANIKHNQYSNLYNNEFK